MKRKIIVILLVLILITNSFTSVYASPVAVALGAKELVALGGLLVAGGLVYANQDEIKKSATDFYYNCMDFDLREAFHNSLNLAKDGIVHFTKATWTKVKDYASQNVFQLEQYAVDDGHAYTNYPGMNYSTIYVYGHAISVIKLSTLSDGIEYGIAVDGELRKSGGLLVENIRRSDTITYNLFMENTYEIKSPLDAPAPWIQFYVDSDAELNAYWKWYDMENKVDSKRLFKIKRYKNGSFTGTYYCAMRAVNMPGTQNISSTNVAVGTGWDNWDQKVEKKGEVAIPLPSTIEDLVDKNFRNVEEQNYTETYDPSVPSDNTGTDTGNTGILQGLTDILNSIKEILKYINPLSENFFLRIALVPSDGFFLNYVTEIKEAFFGKIPIFTQLFDFFTTVMDISVNGGKPKFEVTFPDSYGGGTYSIIDFSMFDEYRVFIFNFIRFTAWFFFLKRLFRMLPYVVYK